MKAISCKSAIRNTLSDVSSFSYKEKRNPFLSEEKTVNEFLDTILDFKKALTNYTQDIDIINQKIEKLTWYNHLDEESLQLINNIIANCRDLHSSLIRNYVGMKEVRLKGIAKDEIKAYKNSIDELKENFTDIESVFFHLPDIPGFLETTKLLSLV